MKVIMLDHDGVICLEQQWGSRFNKKMDGSTSVDSYFDDFDEKAIEILNEILTETGAEIVISSDWKKFADISEMREYYELHGIKKSPYDYTPYYSNIPNGRFGTPLAEARAVEISTWLKDHPEVTHWVAVDDLDMSVMSCGDRGLTNFVPTYDIEKGIAEDGVKEKILEFLAE